MTSCVPFAEYRLFYRALSQKRPIILKSLLIVADILYDMNVTKSYIHACNIHSFYGVATVSRLLKIIGIFCRISSLLYGSFAKETHDFKEPTNRSHPI